MSIHDTWKEPIFKVGQKVVCLNPYGYKLTEGRIYEVLEYIKAEHMSGGFVSRASVIVMADSGKKVYAFASRFEEV